MEGSGQMAENVPAEVEQRVERAARGPADSIVERLARTIGAQTGVQAVYGAPVERDGVTVIPVAKVRYGFGGGSGRGPAQKSEGSDEGSGESTGEGGGAGVSASPLGYIEIRDGQAEFKRIKDPAAALAVLPLVVAGGLTMVLVMRGLRKFIRG
jgi:uncharacterized spore protein YtfJ